MTYLPYRISAICTGNICRSPIAEAVLRQRFGAAGLSAEVAVDSGGVDSWHLGQDADPRARRVLADAGYPLSHAARRVERRWFADHDLLLALDSGHYRELVGLATGAEREKVRMLLEYSPLGRGITPPDRRLDVPDPYYGAARDFEEVLALVEGAATGVVAEVSELLEGRSRYAG